MNVMAAGVHHALLLRGKREPGLLLNGQRVHVGPQGHRGALSAGRDHAHHTVHTGQHGVGNVQPFQFPADQSGGLLLPVGQFGMAVDLTAKGDGIRCSLSGSGFQKAQIHDLFL